MHLLLFGLSQAFAQSSSVAVLDVSCSEQASMCDSVITAVRNQVQRQLAAVEIDPIPYGKMTSILSAQSIEPQCTLGLCEEKIAALIGATWIINGKYDKPSQAFNLALYDATTSTPLIETALKAVNDGKVNARAATAVSTLLTLILPDTSHEIGSLFANVPATVLGEGTLKIETNPPGVAFVLNGEKRITTPYESKLPAGVHHLVIDDPCHWSKESRFLLSNGERLVKSINIIEKTANLDIKIKDASADNPNHAARVIVDDKQLGHTPFRQPINVCSTELVLRTPTRFWSHFPAEAPGKLRLHRISSMFINFDPKREARK